jgi:hypothetical protein
MGFIYLISSGLTDKYKIGVSKKPPNRKKELQTGNPFELSVVKYYESEFCYKIESVLHRLLKYKKYVSEDFSYLKGEWFNLTNEDVKNFVFNCKKIEKGIIIVKKDLSS